MVLPPAGGVIYFFLYLTMVKVLWFPRPIEHNNNFCVSFKFILKWKSTIYILSWNIYSWDAFTLNPTIILLKTEQWGPCVCVLLTVSPGFPALQSCEWAVMDVQPKMTWSCCYMMAVVWITPLKNAYLFPFSSQQVKNYINYIIN